MPSNLPKQTRFQSRPVRRPSMDRSAGLSLSVAREFNQADLSKRNKSFALASALRKK